MSIELAHVVRTYDVEYKGEHYSLIRSEDMNIDFPDTQILLEGVEVDDETFEEVFEYFVWKHCEKEVDADRVEF